MRPPDPKTRLLGHPVTVVAAWGLVGTLAYQLVMAGEGWLALLCTLFLAPVMNANSRVREYQLWQAEWDAMGGQSAPRQKNRPAGKLIALLLLAPFAYLYNEGQISGAGFVVVGLAVAVGMLMVVGIFRAARAVAGSRGGRAANPKPVAPVAVCAKRHLPPIPTGEAFNRLPAHCMDVLGAGL